MKNSTEAAGPTMLSIRVTAKERRLIEEAARQKGWKVASFLRVSALDRAVHVLNLSAPTSLDFSGAARRLARVLLAPRDVGFFQYEEGHRSLGRLKENESISDCPGLYHEITQNYGDGVVPGDIQPAPLTADQVEELSQAVRLGGAEFAAELLVECRRLLSGDSNLPAPIDPNNLQDKE